MMIIIAVARSSPNEFRSLRIFNAQIHSRSPGVPRSFETFGAPKIQRFIEGSSLEVPKNYERFDSRVSKSQKSSKFPRSSEVPEFESSAGFQVFVKFRPAKAIPELPSLTSGSSKDKRARSPTISYEITPLLTAFP